MSSTDREQKLALARKKLERFQSNRNPRTTAVATPAAPVLLPTTPPPPPPPLVTFVNNNNDTDTIAVLNREKQELLDIQGKLSTYRVLLFV
jgi:hypothetical protein